MRNGPVKIVLIHAGKYEYAEVELDGAIQIVGQNNSGKTTLINTLQFLYIDERDRMNFGSYSRDQTFEYYFPSLYSYVLFECRTLRGQAVIGWRGSSKTSSAMAERFFFLGPYRREDFFTETGQVRERQDVSARLAQRDLQLTPKAQQHREALLVGAGEDGVGLGIVSLKDNDKFHHFRETLKNLLSLSTISQEQMRERLLMLAEIPSDQPALEKRKLLGDDHDRMLQMRDELRLFKEHEGVVRELLDKFETCQRVRSELMYRWTILKQRKEAYDAAHNASLAALDQKIANAQTQEQTAIAALLTKRRERDGLIAQQTTLDNYLRSLPVLAKEFAGFGEELERAALDKLETQVVQKRSLLADAANEKLASVEEKLDEVASKIASKEQAVQHFNELVVTALREKFSDEELASIFAILNPELLEYPLNQNGVTATDRETVVKTLRKILAKSKNKVYKDESVTIHFRPASAALARLENVEKLQAELLHLQSEKKRIVDLKDAVLKRQKHEIELAALTEQKNKQASRIHRFDEFQASRQKEPEWSRQLAEVQKAINVLDAAITGLDAQGKEARIALTKFGNQRQEIERQFAEVMSRFGKCQQTIFDATPSANVDIPDDFDFAIACYLDEQSKERTLAQGVEALLVQVQRFLGDRYQGNNDPGTIRNLREQLEAVSEREEALKHEWKAHIHDLKRRFAQVLDDLNDIQAAATRLTRSFAQVQVSDLKAIKLSVKPNADTLSIIERIARVEELDLWADQAPLETALQRVREWLDATPIVRVVELFTLEISVTGPDGKVKHYSDFHQIESDGTTVALKVLFNLLVLKSQLRKEDVAVPFFLDEVEKLDSSNRRAVLQTAKSLGFIAITAAPSAVGEVDACYFLERRPSGNVKLTSSHRLELKPKNTRPKPV